MSIDVLPYGTILRFAGAKTTSMAKLSAFDFGLSNTGCPAGWTERVTCTEWVPSDANGKVAVQVTGVPDTQATPVKLTPAAASIYAL